MMRDEAEIRRPLSGRAIALLVASALAVGLLILFAAVLPAEYNRDPSGLGRLTGIARLWAPEETSAAPTERTVANARSYPMPWRSDVVDIALKPGGDPDRGDELEYKVRLPKGGSYVYSWSVAGVPAGEFYTEFHGHTVVPGQPMTVAYYRKATGTADNGVLTAPFDGVHGWYFQNQSERPATVRLKLAGFYTLIPDGQPGNEAGLHAKPLIR